MKARTRCDSAQGAATYGASREGELPGRGASRQEQQTGLSLYHQLVWLPKFQEIFLLLF
jgi:hypothetical protein